MAIPYIANRSRWKSFVDFAGQLANAKLFAVKDFHLVLKMADHGPGSSLKMIFYFLPWGRSLE